MKPVTGKLGELVEIISGFAFKSSDFNNDGVGVPLVRIRDVVPGRSTTSYSGPYDPRFVVHDGDYLIGMDGEFNVARWRGGKALLNQRVCKLGEVDGKLDRHYLGRFLPIALKKIEDVKPFVTVKHLSVRDLREIEVPLPPIEEQRRIAAILDQADALRVKRRQSLGGIDQLADSIKHSLFSTRAGAVRPLSDWLDPARPLTYGILKPGPDILDGVPYIRVADIQSGRVVEKTVRRTSPEIARQYRRSTLQEGDILISIRGHVGRMARVPASLAGANITQDSARLSISGGNPGYVRAALESVDLQRWMAQRTKGAAVRGINLGDLRNAPIPDLPLDVQNRIAGELELLEAQRDRLTAQMRIFDALYFSLQAQAFTGSL